MSFNNRAIVIALNDAITAISSTRNAIDTQRTITDATLAILQDSSNALSNAQTSFDNAVRSLQAAVANLEDPTAGLQPINTHLVQRTIDAFSGDEAATVHSTTVGMGVFGVGVGEGVENIGDQTRDVVAILQNSVSAKQTCLDWY